MDSKKILIFVTIALAIAALVWFFYPKMVGAVFMGTKMSPSVGLVSYNQDCLGIPVTADYGTAIFCYGLPVGKRRCYGVPYTNQERNPQSTLMDCNYPCDDEAVRQGCANVHDGNLTFREITLFCKPLREKCGWHFAEV
jgi:hypothetical protein